MVINGVIYCYSQSSSKRAFYVVLVINKVNGIAT